ncbi:peptidase, M16 family [Ancylostoma duodenale]|uniref:Peptidase, M16 family n=1 Tax=Ancylostoma duodenale TaxID=51022 RepID=A0A0C2CSJ4_9BILA|nr:peptidase, M16 family [Ancylostoma duodenale]
MSQRWTKSELLMNGTIAVSLYRSRRSKLAVAIGDVPGPMVKGCISFATEADSDDGLPHTLEHLVFMGSKKFPFKGFLDIVANRCLAQGTNAYTDQDRTVYTLSTDSHFATEVHHINGKGEDAGVVYCEMQDDESNMESLVDRKKKEVLYPTNNPYCVDVAGRLKTLRETCTPDRV